MKTIFRILFIYLFILLFVHSAFAEQSIILETSFLRIQIVPESSGRIISFYDKIHEREHLAPLEEETIEVSPLLPLQFKSNNAGIKELFWKRRLPIKAAFQLSNRGEDAQSVWAEVSGKLNEIEIVRRMILLKNAPVLRVEVRLRSEEPQAVSYWAHMLVSEQLYMDKGTGTGHIAGNFAADNAPRQKRAILAPETAGVQIIDIGFGDRALAPAGNWFARVSTKAKQSLILQVVDSAFISEGGFFYVWQDTEKRIASLETVWQPVEIGGEKEAKIRYNLILVDTIDPERIEQTMR